MGLKDGTPTLGRVSRTRWLSALSFTIILTMSLYTFWTNYAKLPSRHAKPVTLDTSGDHHLDVPEYGPFPPLDGTTDLALPSLVSASLDSSTQSHHQSSTTSSPAQPSPTRYTTTLVAGRLSSEVDRVRWIDEQLEDVDRKAVYVVDDPSAPLHLDDNRGREAMVYLRYIIDHYDNLTDITIFLHSHDKAWHNNLLLRRSNVMAVNRLNRAYVAKQGYFNTRCDLYPGCPNWIHFNPSDEEASLDPTRVMDMFTDELWAKLFPNVRKPPEWISAPCCSQFAVARATIKTVPLETFKRLRDWIASEYLDMYTGRVMELLWHYIFLGKHELCPSMSECYCQAYGLCFEDDGLLDGWYHLSYEEGRAGFALEKYDRGIRGGLRGDAAEALVGDDPEHIRLVEAGKAARTNRMNAEGQLRNKHALGNAQ